MKLMLLLFTSQEWLAFMGRFHPLLVHLPIGFLVALGILELLQKLGKLSLPTAIVKVILLISAISGTLSCLAGYFLSRDGGYESEILVTHQWLGMSLTFFCWLAWLSTTNFIRYQFPKAAALYLPSFSIATILMIIAGHQGGSLTHGSNYLGEATPEPLRSFLGINPIADEKEVKISIKDLNQAMVFQDVIHPILKNRCEKCHNAQKSKGDLRMDSIELLKKGGKEGEIFISGDAEKSEMIKRILLPIEEEHHMPPKSKKQISANELALLKWWIQTGASFDKKVTQLPMDSKITPILTALTTADGLEAKNKNPSIEDSLFKQSVTKIDDKTLEELRKTGALVVPIAQNSNFLEVSFINNHQFSDAKADVLSKIALQTVWLKVGKTQITDQSLQPISQFKNLTRLSLENTKITDVGLAFLGNLNNLEYLNLINTPITDAGIQQLGHCKNLKNIYVWQTAVTPTGVANLKKMLPKVNVNLGVTQNQIQSFAQNKRDSTAEKQ